MHATFFEQNFIETPTHLSEQVGLLADLLKDLAIFYTLQVFAHLRQMIVWRSENCFKRSRSFVTIELYFGKCLLAVLGGFFPAAFLCLERIEQLANRFFLPRVHFVELFGGFVLLGL